MRAQVEISQTRSEIDKLIAEKEEESENHERMLESMEARLETETRQRADCFARRKSVIAIPMS